ncbi:MAG: nucleotidyltransferase domain-containing protein [Bacteroidota bacterium]
MLTKEVILDYLKLNKNQLSNSYQLEKLGLFGSFATDQASDDSDIDLLIDFKPNTEKIFEKKLALRKQIEAKFNRSVDLCTEKYMKPYFKEYILKSTIYV